MRAAWYETQGAPHDVLVVGQMADPVPAPGEVLMRVAASGINPGDVKKRSDAFGVGMPYPRVVPHSDGSGVIEALGDGVTSHSAGDRVWCFGAQSYRAFGTSAELVAVPEANVASLPGGVSFLQGACLGIPGITGHRAVHVHGPIGANTTVLVQGGAGAVGLAAVGAARHAGARVIATVRREEQEQVVHEAGADEVVRTNDLSPAQIVERILDHAPEGVDHVVEVAFDANISVDEQVLRQGGSIATYASRTPNPEFSFWPLVFKNVRIHFLGSDDFALEDKRRAANDLTEMLRSGWAGYPIAKTFRLDQIADAHAAVEAGAAGGRIVLDLAGTG